MEIHYRNRSRLSPEIENGAKFHESIKSLFSVSDVLSICCPATKETKDDINKETLRIFSNRCNNYKCCKRRYDSDDECYG